MNCEKGQKRGLYVWVATSNNTWDRFPRKQEKTRAKYNLHFFSTLRLSILRKKLIKGGYIRTVKVTESPVPRVAAPSKL